MAFLFISHIIQLTPQQEIYVCARMLLNRSCALPQSATRSQPTPHRLGRAARRSRRCRASPSRCARVYPFVSQELRVNRILRANNGDSTSHSLLGVCVMCVLCVCVSVCVFSVSMVFFFFLCARVLLTGVARWHGRPRRVNRLRTVWSAR